MVHTLPDYTTKYKMATIFGQIDSGELAARIHPISLLDRGGNVVWYDDFEGPALNWATAKSGAGASIDLTAARCFTGTQSLALTAGSTLSKYAYITKYMDILTAGKIGIEAMIDLHTSTDYILFDIFMYDGANYYQSRLKLDQTNGRIQCNDGGLAFTTVASGLEISSITHHWVYLKFVVDMANARADRCIFQTTPYDLTDYDFYSVPGGSGIYIAVEVEHYGVAGNPVAYVDNVIITQNEV